MKKFNNISYETTEPILMKLNLYHLYVCYTTVSKIGHDPKFKMAAMPIYYETIQILPEAYGAPSYVK